MLQIYFTENNKEWSTDQLHEMLLPLPVDMRSKILAYQGWQERQSRILGKWMLMKVLHSFKLDLSLEDLKYGEFNKPVLSPSPSSRRNVRNCKPKERGGNAHFDFSIAHSGEMVICAGAMNAQIGVDIEKIRPIELADCKDHLTADEWQQIHNVPDSRTAFYNIWTKKEALIKALGRGVGMDLAKLDVCGDTVVYEGITYWFYGLSIAENYVAHIAINVPIDKASLKAERLTQVDLPANYKAVFIH